MKKLLIGAVVVGALLGQLSAFEAFKDGDKSLSVFGEVNAVLGYGWNFESFARTGHFQNVGLSNEIVFIRQNYYKRVEQNDIIFGIQGNSRIGLSFSVGKVFGIATLGAQESFSGISSGSGSNFRQLYAGYDFGEGGKLLAGKNELITSMGGFSSDIFNNESGLNGFGGTSTSTRRFQIAYSIAGFTVSISENEFGSGASYKNWQKQIPRISLGYEYNSDSLRAKVAASYAHRNDDSWVSSGMLDGHRDTFLLTAGVRPVFGNSYLSVLLTYGLNAQISNHNQYSKPTLNRGYGNTNISNDYKYGLGYGDANAYAVMIEFGHNFTRDLAIKMGLGYQYVSVFNKRGTTWYQDDMVVIMPGYNALHSYSAFVQLPYKVGEYFSIIPQVGYLGTSKKVVPTPNRIYINFGDVLGEILFKFAF